MFLALANKFQEHPFLFCPNIRMTLLFLDLSAWCFREQSVLVLVAVSYGKEVRSTQPCLQGVLLIQRLSGLPGTHFPEFCFH